MVVLRWATRISTFCFALVLLYVLASLSGDGFVEVGGRFFEFLFVYPTLLAIPAVVIGAVAALVARGTWMGRGQLLSVVLPVTGGLLFAASSIPSTGWELLVLPLAILPGQCVAAGGLMADHLSERRLG